jgi:hypothetical protein
MVVTKLKKINKQILGGDLAELTRSPDVCFSTTASSAHETGVEPAVYAILDWYISMCYQQHRSHEPWLARLITLATA